MTVSLREAHSSKHRISLAAVRSTLLMLLALLGLCGASSAFAQGLSPGTAIHFGNVNLGSTGPFTQQFTGPSGGVTLAPVTRGHLRRYR